MSETSWVRPRPWQGPRRWVLPGTPGRSLLPGRRCDDADRGHVTVDEAREIALEAARALLAELPGAPDREPAIVDAETLEKPWGWVFFWNTRLYVETGDHEHALFGTAPVCVSRADGAAASVDASKPLHRELRRHERRIGARPWWRFW